MIFREPPQVSPDVSPVVSLAAVGDGLPGGGLVAALLAWLWSGVKATTAGALRRAPPHDAAQRGPGESSA